MKGTGAMSSKKQKVVSGVLLTSNDGALRAHGEHEASQLQQESASVELVEPLRHDHNSLQ